MSNFAMNTILYGPPGTGKTYHSVIHAVAIVEEKVVEEIEKEDYQDVFKRYKGYKKEGKIVFTTFHQSYGYEEFIEGIKPSLAGSDDDPEELLEYKIVPGVFKKFCERANRAELKGTISESNPYPTIWKVSLDGSGGSNVKNDCFDNNRIRIGWAEMDKVITNESFLNSKRGKTILPHFQDGMAVGDIVLTLLDQNHIDGIGIVAGDAEWLDSVTDGHPRSRKVKWIKTRIKENIIDINNGNRLVASTLYKLNNIDRAAVFEMIKKYSEEQVETKENKDNYVFIIDEINRGNISKIFGELITLIEHSKRIGAPEGATARLPYSGDDFGVPKNVHILGTMNTADRSIALMDTALRRRFDFKEMMPRVDLLSGVKVGEVDVYKMLEAINTRIEVLYDREHTIGHAFFMPLKDELTAEKRMTKLADIFRHSIIPLLQEYFYDDYAKIQLVLGDNAKEEGKYKFIIEEPLKVDQVFKGNPDIDLPEMMHNINENAFAEEKSYIQIYE